MALTIDDIYDKEFALKGGGYDRNDVDQFLDDICDEMTNMQEHIAQLESELERARAEAEAARNAVRPEAQPVVVRNEPVARTSETLEGILLSAQRLADEAVQNAQAKADGILKEAEDKASHMVEEAQGEMGALKDELDRLRKSVADYRSSALETINKYKKLVEDDSFLRAKK